MHLHDVMISVYLTSIDDIALYTDENNEEITNRIITNYELQITSYIFQDVKPLSKNYKLKIMITNHTKN